MPLAKSLVSESVCSCSWASDSDSGSEPSNDREEGDIDWYQTSAVHRRRPPSWLYERLKTTMSKFKPYNKDEGAQLGCPGSYARTGRVPPHFCHSPHPKHTRCL